MPYSVADDVKVAVDLIRAGAECVSFEAIARKIVPDQRMAVSRKNKVNDLVKHRGNFKAQLVRYLGPPPKGAKDPDNYLSVRGDGACRVIPITAYYEKQRNRDKEYAPRTKEQLLRCVAGLYGSTPPSGYLLADRAPRSIALIWNWLLEQTDRGVLTERIINLQIAEVAGHIPPGTAVVLERSHKHDLRSGELKQLLANGDGLSGMTPDAEE